MKKWSLILLLWYIFADQTPWIQELEKKTVWILMPGYSTWVDCNDFKVRIFEILNGVGREYMCIDMNPGTRSKPTNSLDLRDVVEHMNDPHQTFVPVPTPR